MGWDWSLKDIVLYCNLFLAPMQAGEKHFHPSCATCCRCSHTFAEGEDMCVFGEDIWHLDCNRRNGRSGVWGCRVQDNIIMIRPVSTLHTDKWLI